MRFKEKQNKCIKYFNELCGLLSETHEVMINKSTDMYLVPKGTKNQITYYGKPLYSFRYSNKWNWFTDRCKNQNHAQCYSKDLPRPHHDDEFAGKGPGGAILAHCVGYYGDDKSYHVVYGEKYDRETRTWSWVESSPLDVISELIYTKISFEVASDMNPDIGANVTVSAKDENEARELAQAAIYAFCGSEEDRTKYFPWLVEDDPYWYSTGYLDAVDDLLEEHGIRHEVSEMTA